jgi:hypothetical protein
MKKIVKCNFSLEEILEKRNGHAVKLANKQDVSLCDL